jgi:SOS-response transcriptional repressor LexA
MNLSERIHLIFKESGLKQKEFASSVGITEGYISKLLKGGLDNVSESLALLIEEKYGYAAEWIMTGEGQPKKAEKRSSFLRAKTIKLLDGLSEDEMKAVMAFVQSMDDLKKIFSTIEKETLCTTEDPEEYQVRHTIPVLGRVAAGMPILAVQEYGKTILTHVKCDCALELQGDSMEPDYLPGDIILIQRKEELFNGELGVVLIMREGHEAEASFKRFYQENGRIILRSINTKYPDQILSSADIRVFGKVVGKA